MRNLKFTGNYNGKEITLKQIQKRSAQKWFDLNLTVYIQTSNFNPFGMLSSCMSINKMKEAGLTFDKVINEFESYNCNNESGLYTSFYIIAN